jgi:hypothetical protein
MAVLVRADSNLPDPKQNFLPCFRDLDGIRSNYYGHYISSVQARKATEVDSLGKHRWKILLPEFCFQNANPPFHSEIMTPKKIDVNKNLLLVGRDQIFTFLTF